VRTHRGEAELICGEDLFMQQFVKDLQRHFIVRRCAGHDIAGTFPVKGVKQFPLAGSLPLTGKYARFTRLKRYIGVGNFVIQSVRFRFGHSCHFSILKIKRAINSFFADAVFEGGFIELDVKFHASL
jgi:hypothetical protein